MAEIVDQKSRIPKYLQIGGWIEEMIAKGRFQVGDRLPSEARLAAFCGVNRNTIRQAISELVRRGLVTTKNGVGTFISSRIPERARYSLDRISSFSEDVRYAGYTPKTKLISKRVVEATREISERLMLGSRSKIIQVVRLRMGDEIPLILERSHLPYEEFSEILEMDLTGSLYRLLADRFGLELDRSVQNFRGVLLTGLEARLLRVPPGSPGIFLESIIYDTKGVAVELLQSHYRGDKYVFQVHSGHYRVNLEAKKESPGKEVSGNG
ncbi:MAG: GntR family transcriptional regulator [Deltaproteobacteria bacterium]|nr:GntR family transcriptional regulator [Deltaproteobacteria bacterium]